MSNLEPHEKTEITLRWGPAPWFHSGLCHQLAVEGWAGYLPFPPTPTSAQHWPPPPAPELLPGLRHCGVIKSKTGTEWKPPTPVRTA